nr:hypothetical protein [Tanacetum cinerariifolium]
GSAAGAADGATERVAVPGTRRDGGRPHAHAGTGGRAPRRRQRAAAFIESRSPPRAGQRLGAGAAKGERQGARDAHAARRHGAAASDLAAGQADRAVDAQPPALLRF